MKTERPEKPIVYCDIDGLLGAFKDGALKAYGNFRAVCFISALSVHLSLDRPQESSGMSDDGFRDTLVFLKWRLPQNKEGYNIT